MSFSHSLLRSHFGSSILIVVEMEETWTAVQPMVRCEAHQCRGTLELHPQHGASKITTSAHFADTHDLTRCGKLLWRLVTDRFHRSLPREVHETSQKTDAHNYHFSPLAPFPSHIVPSSRGHAEQVACYSLTIFECARS